MTLQESIEKMKALAYNAHDGQYRNDGKTPYFTHVERVANSVEDRLKPIAYGHDLVEDTTVTINDLYKFGFPEYIIEAVSLLTHGKDQPNVEYWSAIAKNADATAVKLADIRDNLSDAPSERQIQKYTNALNIFKQSGYSINENSN